MTSVHRGLAPAIAFFCLVCVVQAEELFGVRAGFILPLSGPAASWGQNTRDGALLALRDLPPQLARRIDLAFEDDQLRGNLAVSAFNKMASQGLDLVVLFGAQSAGPVIPLSEREGIPSVTIAAQTKLVEGKRLALRHWIDSGSQAKLLVEFLARSGVKSVGIVFAAHEGMIDFTVQFAREAEAAGISIVAREEVRPDERDFRGQVLKFRRGDVQGIVQTLLPGQLSIFARQRGELGVAAPLYGFTASENGNEVRAANGALDGLIYVGPDYADDFVSRYEQAYGRYPEVAAGNAYDLVLMIADALRNNVRDRAQLYIHLHTLRRIDGSMGTYGAGRNNDFDIPAALKRVRGGRFEKLPVRAH